MLQPIPYADIMSFFLDKKDDILGLFWENMAGESPLTVDFTQGKIHYRHLQQKHDKELIEKAIGYKGSSLRVFDTTAGLGQEAFLLATKGCEMVLFERHPLIAALLQDGLTRAAKNPTLAPILSRMQFISGCAIYHLQHLDALNLLPPEVIYCDPMFETRKKSAASKKAMQVLQKMVGEDIDAEKLVEIAYQVTQKRLVVKRALRAPLLKPKPTFQYFGKSHRYDIYLKIV